MRFSTAYKIAHTPLANCTTIAVFRIHNNNTDILIEQRKLDPEAGKWVLPGGHVEDTKNETAVDAAVRELKEETNIDITPDGLTFIAEKSLDIAEKGRTAKDVLWAVIVSPDTKFKAMSDAGDLKWVNINQIPALAFHHNDFAFAAINKMFGNQSVKAAVNSLSHRFKLPENIFIKGLSVKQAKKETYDNGLLIAFEGNDGSGKSKNVASLYEWLKKDLGYKVFQTKWNSSELLKDCMKEAKQDKCLSPMLYCLMHCADFLLRYEYEITPALEKNKIVICDRYIYTSLARDAIRDIDPEIPKSIYKDVREPDIVFHCCCDLDKNFDRLMDEKGITYYGCGQDIEGIGENEEEICKNYLKLTDKEYHKILPDCKNYYLLDTNKSIEDVFDEVKQVLLEKFDLKEPVEEEDLGKSYSNANM